MHRHRTHHWSHHRTHHWSHHRAHWSRPYAYGVFWKPGDIIVFQVSNMAGPIEEDAIWPCAAEACSKFDNHKDWYQLNLGKKTAIMLSIVINGLFLSVRNLELQLTVPARLIPSNHSVAWAAFSTGKSSEVTFGQKKQLRGKSVLNLKARLGSAFCDPRLEAQHKQCRRLESIVTGNIYKDPGMLWSGISRSQIQ